MFLSPVHEPCPVAFHLMAGRHGTESDLAQCLTRRAGKRAIRDTTYTLIVRWIHDSDGSMAPLKDEAGDVLLGHVWELLGVNVLQVSKPACPYPIQQNTPTYVLVM